MKIIGIVLLSILGILILLAAIVLFVPVRYQIEGRYPDQPMLHGQATWLLHIFKGKADYEDGEFTYEIRIFGFKLPFSSEQSVQEDGDTEDLPVRKKKSENNREKSQKIPKKSETDAKQSKPADSEKISKEESKTASKEQVSGESSFKEKVEKFKHIISDEKNKEAISFLFSEFKSIQNRIMPKQMKGHLDYSLGSPDYTGYVLVFCTALPFMYDKKFTLNADFLSDDIYLDTDIITGGKVQFFPILNSSIRIYKNQNVRRLLHKVRRKG